MKRQLPTFLLNSYSGWGFIFFRRCQWLPSNRINYKYAQKEKHIINFKWGTCICSLWLYTYRFERLKHATSKLYKNIWSLFILGNNYLMVSWGGNCISPIIKVYVHVHVHIQDEYIKNFSTLILVNKLDYKIKIHTIQYELYMFK